MFEHEVDIKQSNKTDVKTMTEQNRKKKKKNNPRIKNNHVLHV